LPAVKHSIKIESARQVFLLTSKYSNMLKAKLKVAFNEERERADTLANQGG
jgi:hypothetical protein